MFRSPAGADRIRQVLLEVANALGVHESGRRPLIEDLRAALADKHALICIDNWEHVLEAAPQLAELLMVCPYFLVLATSREALRLHGEHQFLVHPFSGLPHKPMRSNSSSHAQRCTPASILMTPTRR